jgi:hypothetical protein
MRNWKYIMDKDHFRFGVVSAIVTISVWIGQGAFATSPASPPAAQTGCVTIPATGLSWELKTDDGGVHDKDNRYRWGGTGTERTGAQRNAEQQSGSIFYDDWNSLVSAANNEKLCGFEDWRVPTIEELKTLVITRSEPPLIDTRLFPLTLAEPYWSVTAYAHYPEHAQTVDFATGASNYYQGFRGNRLPVRLVRGQMRIALP